MKEPRPAMISARPRESRSSVAKLWKTRTGSSELSTVTALLSLIRSVLRGDRREHHLGCRGCEVGPVVLADGVDVEADAVGEGGLLDHLQQPLAGADRLPAGQLGER